MANTLDELTCQDLRNILRSHGEPNISKLRRKKDLMAAVRRIFQKDFLSGFGLDLKTKIYSSLQPVQIRAASVVSKTQFTDTKRQIQSLSVLNIIQWLHNFFQEDKDTVLNFYGVEVEHECHIILRLKDHTRYDIHITQHTPARQQERGYYTVATYADDDMFRFQQFEKTEQGRQVLIQYVIDFIKSLVGYTVYVPDVKTISPRVRSYFQNLR